MNSLRKYGFWSTTIVLISDLPTGKGIFTGCSEVAAHVVIHFLRALPSLYCNFPRHCRLEYKQPECLTHERANK